MALRLAIAALLFPLAGCSSIANLVEDPRAYGGTKDSCAAMGGGGFAHFFDFGRFLDLPGTLVLDTALLPATIPIGMVRDARDRVEVPVRIRAPGYGGAPRELTADLRLAGAYFRHERRRIRPDPEATVVIEEDGEIAGKLGDRAVWGLTFDTLPPVHATIETHPGDREPIDFGVDAPGRLVIVARDLDPGERSVQIRIALDAPGWGLIAQDTRWFPGRGPVEMAFEIQPGFYDVEVRTLGDEDRISPRKVVARYERLRIESNADVRRDLAAR